MHGGCWCRYDRNFVPNVCLSVEPFEEVRKQRAAEAVAAMDSEDLSGRSGADDERGTTQTAARRRQASTRPITVADDDEDDVDVDDNESVSSDKCEHPLIYHLIFRCNIAKRCCSQRCILSPSLTLSYFSI